MSFEAKDYSSLLGIEGMNDELLQNHFTLYQGYVKATNTLSDRLNELRTEPSITPEYMELKRRFGWEFDGMRLHELYFGNLIKGGNALTDSMSIKKAIEKDFGSVELWEKDFQGTGSMRGIGWVILYYDPVSKRLMNLWINEHDQGHGAGLIPLLILDVFEHAYMIQYGLKRADYISVFMKNIDWEEVQRRFAQ